MWRPGPTPEGLPLREAYITAELRETLASYVPHTGWIRPDGSIILTDRMDMDEEYRTIALEVRDRSDGGAHHKAWSRGWVRSSNLAVAPDTYYLEGTPGGVERLKHRIVEVTGSKWFGIVKDIFATPRIFPPGGLPGRRPGPGAQGWADHGGEDEQEAVPAGTPETPALAPPGPL